jgi:hypothetical protein
MWRRLRAAFSFEGVGLLVWLDAVEGSDLLLDDE